MNINDEIKRIYEQNKNNPLAWGLLALAVLMLMGALWPLFIIGVGYFFYNSAKTGERGSAGMIFPGVIIGGTGLILLYQSITGHWESWAYAWALYPVMVGYAMRFNGERMNRPGEMKRGRELMENGLKAFVGLALFFELIIFGGISFWLLLAAGLGLLWWNGNIKLGSPERDAEYREKVRDFVKEKREQVKVELERKPKQVEVPVEPHAKAEARVKVTVADESSDDENNTNTPTDDVPAGDAPTGDAPAGDAPKSSPAA